MLETIYNITMKSKKLPFISWSQQILPGSLIMKPIACFNHKLHKNELQCTQHWPCKNILIVSMGQMAETSNKGSFYIRLGLLYSIYNFQRNCQWGLLGNNIYLLLCHNYIMKRPVQNLKTRVMSNSHSSKYLKEQQ